MSASLPTSRLPLRSAIPTMRAGVMLAILTAFCIAWPSLQTFLTPRFNGRTAARKGVILCGVCALYTCNSVFNHTVVIIVNAVCKPAYCKVCYYCKAVITLAAYRQRQLQPGAGAGRPHITSVVTASFVSYAAYNTRASVMKPGHYIVKMCGVVKTVVYGLVKAFVAGFLCGRQKQLFRIHEVFL